MKKELAQTEFELIEAYVNGTLSATEKKVFDERLAGDTDLQEEVRIHRDNVTAIEMAGFERAMNEVAGEYRRENPAIDPRPERKDGTKWVLRLAAIVAVAVGVGWFITRPAPHERLYAEYHVADPGLPVPMSATDDHAFHDAMVDLKKGAYEKAITKWNGLLREEPNNDTLHYYLGTANLEAGYAQQALEHFGQVLGNSGSTFRHKAEWYSLLTWLKQGEKDKALQAPIAERSPYAAQATELKQKLKE